MQLIWQEIALQSIGLLKIGIAIIDGESGFAGDYGNVVSPPDIGRSSLAKGLTASQIACKLHLSKVYLWPVISSSRLARERSSRGSGRSQWAAIGEIRNWWYYGHPLTT